MEERVDEPYAAKAIVSVRMDSLISPAWISDSITINRQNQSPQDTW